MIATFLKKRLLPKKSLGRTSFCLTARRDSPRRAALIPRHKINGRLCEPPIKWLQKNRKVWFWCLYTTLLELTLSKISEKSNRSAPPPCRQAALPHRKIAFPLRKKSARAKSKNDKAIFLLGSVLTNKAAGLRLRLAGKNFPSQTPPIFAYEPNKRSKNALWLFGAAGL